MFGALLHKTRKIWSHVWHYLRHHVFILILLIISIIFIVGGIFFFWLGGQEIPNLDSFDNRKISQSTKIYDRTGEILLYDVHENIRRTIITQDDISAYVKNAIVAIEDDEFYEHKGVDVRATFRAIIFSVSSKLGLRDGSLQGGSTITQQVVKNTLLTSDRRISRKVKEWFLSFKLEQQLTKDEILTHYLNIAPYGGTIYGIEEASRSFFGKSASSLTVAESAYLAALPNAPTYFSPYGQNKDKLENRKNLTLRRMRELGFITDEVYDEARNEEVEFRPQSDDYAKAMHFVQYIRSYLEENYGRDAVLNEGLKVTTTLDYDLQQRAETIVSENAIINEEEWNARNQGAIALDPRSGEILAMVGSRDYFDTEIDGNFNITLAHRQPGSSFKPFVYATAIDEGYTDTTILFDVRTQFSVTCPILDFTNEGDCYSPRNYDGEYDGPITLRTALAQSRNIPAVKVLYLAGLEDSLATAKRLGISTLDRNANRYGLTLVLGGGEVTLLDMTSAYGVFANSGMRNEPTGILRIEKNSGEVLEEFQSNPRRVIKSNTAAWINSILDDDEARIGLFSSINNFMYFGERPVAAKTGTTNDNKDAWLVGYTPQITIGVWTGNNNNDPMTRGSSISANTWRSLMEYSVRRLPIAYFDEPQRDPDYENLHPILRGKWQGGKAIKIDSISKKLATEYTPEETIEELIIPEPHTILHWINKDNPRDTPPIDPAASSNQYRRWDVPVQQWVQENSDLIEEVKVPTDEDDVHTSNSQPEVIITSPNSGEEFSDSDTITITLDTTSTYPIKETRFFINGTFITTDTTSPFSTSVELSTLSVRQSNQIEVIVYDEVLNSTTTTTTFTID